MALGFLLGKSDFVTSHDVYFVPECDDVRNACRVFIKCPGKDRLISAVLSEGLNISVDSQWKSIFNGGVGSIGAKALDILDNVAQIVGGYTIRQPYFGRKYWLGTSPLSFQLSFQFVTFDDAKTDVYEPMVALMSLLYPRLGREGSSAGVLDAYFIPGPNLFYDPTNPNDQLNGSADGDRIEIRMGNFLNFKGCYVTKFVGTLENSFSVEGYPNCVKVRMDFETMDIAFVKHDGSFMEDGFGDASVSLGNGLQGIRNLAKTLQENGSRATDTVLSLLNG